MKRAESFLERGLSIFAEFKEDERLISRLNFFFPAVDRFNRWQNIRTGGKFFGDELVRDSVRGLALGKSAEREQNLFRHLLSRNQCFLPANPTATNNHIALVDHRGF